MRKHFITMLLLFIGLINIGVAQIRGNYLLPNGNSFSININEENNKIEFQTYNDTEEPVLSFSEINDIKSTNMVSVNDYGKIAIEAYKRDGSMCIILTDTTFSDFKTYPLNLESNERLMDMCIDENGNIYTASMSINYEYMLCNKISIQKTVKDSFTPIATIDGTIEYEEYVDEISLKIKAKGDIVALYCNSNKEIMKPATINVDDGANSFQTTINKTNDHTYGEIIAINVNDKSSKGFATRGVLDFAIVDNDNIIVAYINSNDLLGLNQNSNDVTMICSWNLNNDEQLNWNRILPYNCYDMQMCINKDFILLASTIYDENHNEFLQESTLALNNGYILYSQNYNYAINGGNNVFLTDQTTGNSYYIAFSYSLNTIFKIEYPDYETVIKDTLALQIIGSGYSNRIDLNEFIYLPDGQYKDLFFMCENAQIKNVDGRYIEILGLNEKGLSMLEIKESSTLYTTVTYIPVFNADNPGLVFDRAFSCYTGSEITPMNDLKFHFENSELYPYSISCKKYNINLSDESGKPIETIDQLGSYSLEFIGTININNDEDYFGNVAYQKTFSDLFEVRETPTYDTIIISGECPAFNLNKYLPEGLQDGKAYDLKNNIVNMVDGYTNNMVTSYQAIAENGCPVEIPISMKMTSSWNPTTVEPSNFSVNEQNLESKIWNMAACVGEELKIETSDTLKYAIYNSINFDDESKIADLSKDTSFTTYFTEADTLNFYITKNYNGCFMMPIKYNVKVYEAPKLDLADTIHLCTTMDSVYLESIFADIYEREKNNSAYFIMFNQRTEYETNAKLGAGENKIFASYSYEIENYTYKTCYSDTAHVFGITNAFPDIIDIPKKYILGNRDKELSVMLFTERPTNDIETLNNIVSATVLDQDENYLILKGNGNKIDVTELKEDGEYLIKNIEFSAEGCDDNFIYDTKYSLSIYYSDTCPASTFETDGKTDIELTAGEYTYDKYDNFSEILDSQNPDLNGEVIEWFKDENGTESLFEKSLTYFDNWGTYTVYAGSYDYDYGCTNKLTAVNLFIPRAEMPIRSVKIERLTGDDSMDSIVHNQTIKLRPVIVPSNNDIDIEWAIEGDSLKCKFEQDGNTLILTATDTSGNINVIMKPLYNGEYYENQNDTLRLRIVAPQKATITNYGNWLCKTAEPIDITNRFTGHPEGGIFYIDGKETSIIDPSVLSTGDHEVIYVYTDEFGNKSEAKYKYFNIYETEKPNIANKFVMEGETEWIIEDPTTDTTIITYWRLPNDERAKNLAYDTTTFDAKNWYYKNNITDSVITFAVYHTDNYYWCASEPELVDVHILPCENIPAPIVYADNIINCDGNEDLQFYAMSDNNSSMYWERISNYNTEDETIDASFIGYKNKFNPWKADNNYLSSLTGKGTVYYKVSAERNGCEDKVGTIVSYQYDKTEYAISVNGKVVESSKKDPALFYVGDTLRFVIIDQDGVAVDNIRSQFTWLINGEQQDKDYENQIQRSFDKSNELIEVTCLFDNEWGCTKGASFVFNIIDDTKAESMAIGKLEGENFVTIDQIEMVENSEQEIVIDILPEDTKVKAVEWTSSDNDVVRAEGTTIYGLKAGEAILTATSLSNSELSQEIKIVVKEYIPTESIITPNMITMSVGETTELNIYQIPENASYPNYEIVTNDNDIIEVNADGSITALEAGMSHISIVSGDGKAMSGLLIIVEDQLPNAQEIVLSETHLVKGNKAKVEYSTTPSIINTNNLVWKVANETLATIDNGIVVATEVGTTTITVTDTISNTTTEAKLRITNSVAPQFYQMRTRTLMQASDELSIDLSQFVEDDSTATENLIFGFVENNHFTITLSGSIIKISNANAEFVGSDIVTLTVTDEENSTSTTDLIINVISKENEAPEFVDADLNISFNDGFNIFDMKQYVKDDFTNAEEMNYSANDYDNEKFTISFKGSQMAIAVNDRSWFGIDSISITASDRQGLSTTNRFAIKVMDKPNTAPVIATLPTLYNNDTLFFSYIELSDYVSDDYTTPSDIRWATEQGVNAELKIFGDVAFATILNPYWSGAEQLELVATDEHGSQSSSSILLLQEQARNDGWKGKLKARIFADKLIGTPLDTITLYSSMSGAESWIWEIENIELDNPSNVMQKVCFDQPGKYSVLFRAMNEDGEVEILKEDYITIIGIENRKPTVCKGDEIELTINANDIDGIAWNNGDTLATITVKPETTTTYSVVLKNGLFTFNDSVEVVVSVPVDLGKDTSICENSVYTLEAGNFESYLWNNGSTNSSIDIDAVGEYSVVVIDNLGCESTDTLNIVGINPLPTLNLGNDTLVCDGERILLDAGIGYQYKWDNGYEGQIVMLSEPATRSVMITDANNCQNADTIDVQFRYPHCEQIGVATFSNTTKNVIVAWEKTFGKYTDKYQVYRETNISDQWSLVQEIGFNDLSVVEDSMTNYLMRAYRYALVTIDSCGNSSEMSQAHKTMHLQTSWNADSERKMNLTWSAYEPHSAVETYLIMRGTDLNNMVAIDSLASDYTSWTDTASHENMIYRVVFRLKNEVNPKRYDNTKVESGPFAMALSNIAEAKMDIDMVCENFAADLTIYPNPATDILNVQINANETENYSLQIFDIEGRLVSTTEANDVLNENIEIPVSQLASGVYNLRISNSKTSQTAKFVK